MPDTMRGVYTNLTDIRRSVFREVAKICYSMDPASGKTDDDLDREFDELPFKIRGKAQVTDTCEPHGKFAHDTLCLTAFILERNTAIGMVCHADMRSRLLGRRNACHDTIAERI